MVNDKIRKRKVCKTNLLSHGNESANKVKTFSARRHRPLGPRVTLHIGHREVRPRQLSQST